MYPLLTHSFAPIAAQLFPNAGNQIQREPLPVCAVSRPKRLQGTPTLRPALQPATALEDSGRVPCLLVPRRKRRRVPRRRFESGVRRGEALIEGARTPSGEVCRRQAPNGRTAIDLSSELARQCSAADAARALRSPESVGQLAPQDASCTSMRRLHSPGPGRRPSPLPA